MNVYVYVDDYGEIRAFTKVRDAGESIGLKLLGCVSLNLRNEQTGLDLPVTELERRLRG